MKLSTESAFKDFLGRKFGEKQKVLLETYFSDLLKITKVTFSNWTSGKHFPKGLELLKLRIFLMSIGYEITEFEGVPDEIISVGKLVAFGKITLLEATVSLEYPETWELLRYLNNKRGVSANRLLIFKKFLEDKSDMLAQVEERMKEALGYVTPRHAFLEKGREKVLVIDDDNILMLKYTLDAIGNLCDAVEPILKNLLDGNDPKIRQAFRDGIKFFPLSNKVHAFSDRMHKVESLLNDMCSEKSREVSNE